MSNKQSSGKPLKVASSSVSEVLGITLVLVFSSFIADATITLVKRSLLGEKVWQAHFEHYYQRLVRSGFGHRNTALLGYVMMLTAGIIALWATRQEAAIQLGTIVVCCAAYLLMIFSFDRYWVRHCSD